MQKKVMALAVAGALAVPMVAAAQNTVQITGRFTYEYARVDGGSTHPDTDYADNPGGSNIRFRDMQKVGGGLTIWGQCETSVDIRGIDENRPCGRNSGIGFKGSFGNVHFGKWDTPIKRALNTGTVGAEATGSLGLSFIAFGGSGGADIGNQGTINDGTRDSVNRQRWKRREGSLAYYESPKFSGFQVLGAFSPGNNAATASNTDTNTKPRLWSISGVYGMGPLEFGLGYEKHQDMGALTATTNLDDHAWGLGVSYEIAKIQVGFTWLDAKYETGPGQETGKKIWTLGADWRLPGPHMISVQYVQARDSTGNGTSISGRGGIQGCADSMDGTCRDTGGDAWSIGYTYRFSKRTTAKVAYVHVSNDSQTKMYRPGSVGGLTLGEDVSTWGMLLKHNF